MSTEVICPDSLVVRSRSGPLPSAERARLDAHLRGCELCRHMLAVGVDLDRETAAGRGDAALLARMADAAVAGVRAAPRVGARPARALSALAILAILGVVSAAGAAAATWAVRARWSAPSPSPAQSSTRPGRTTAARVGVEDIGAREAPAAVAEADGAPVPVEALRPPAPVAATRRPRLVAASSPTPGSLFARANGARRGGDVRGALADYRALQAQFGRSSEALVSHVTMGWLLLDTVKDAGRALEQFDLYLAQREHATLTEEALFGRCRALMSLGRRGEEQTTWRTLLTRFPSSIYARQAGERLAIPSGP